MNTRKIILASTLAVTMTLGGTIWNNKTWASPLYESRNSTASSKDDLNQVLGVTSNEEIFNALYNGHSLSDLAEKNNMDVQKVIDLQVGELTDQLDSRLARGSITLEEYQKQKSEVEEIITKSVYGPQ
jgi:type II secretory pathway component PulF